MSLRILGWDGYDDPRVISPFNEKLGIAVELDAHISDFDAAERVLASEESWDLVNINSPFVRDVLWPAGHIAAVTSERLQAAAANPMAPVFQQLNQWARAPDGTLLGVCQRFGPFNFVVNTDAVSVKMAEDQGFALAEDRKFSGRYGVLDYEDFNVIHVAIASGSNPFLRLDEKQIEAFTQMAEAWYAYAAVVTSDHLELNRALIRRDIDFHLGGGVYTCSPARLAGFLQVRAVTPLRGPIDGHGGISFVEVNAPLASSHKFAEATEFLEYLAQPGTAFRACLAGGSVNPVLQMLEPSVQAQFSAAHLDAMQFDTLENDLSRCAQYQVVPDYQRLRVILRASRSRGAFASKSGTEEYRR